MFEWFTKYLAIPSLIFNIDIYFLFAESGDKVGGTNSGVEAPGKSTSTSNTSDAGKSKKGFSG